jgi:hypothetical protein
MFCNCETISGGIGLLTGNIKPANEPFDKPAQKPLSALAFAVIECAIRKQQMEQG